MARRKKIIEADTRLGRQEIDLDKVIIFPRGLMGFEDKRQFTLLKLGDESPFLILQSLEEPTLGLLVADPYTFTAEYVIKIGDAEQHMLQVTRAEELAVLVTVSIPHGKPDETTLNLTGPILINHDARIGLQAPQVDANPPRLLLRLCSASESTDKPEDAAAVETPASGSGAAVASRAPKSENTSD